MINNYKYNKYPNPMFRRENFIILNGEWDFEIINSDSIPNYTKKIIVPFSYETKENYHVLVEDNGVGFDPDNYMNDGKSHVGIRNVRERLENMVGGSLSISSSENGTVAVVTIPAKEANHTR